MDIGLTNLKPVLDDLANKLRFGDEQQTHNVIEALCLELNKHLKEAEGSGSFGDFLQVCRSHEIRKILAQDPYTSRALNKPKGYAGDAVMLDYIYRPTEHYLSDIGSNIYSATTSSSNANSIRFRQVYLAELISDSVANEGSFEVLSVACGHMRELDLCSPDYAPQLIISALDQDKDTLLTLTEDYPDFSIRTIPESITSILKPTFGGSYDLIYSAGLFAYLNDKRQANSFNPYPLFCIREAFYRLPTFCLIAMGADTWKVLWSGL